MQILWWISFSKLFLGFLPINISTAGDIPSQDDGWGQEVHQDLNLPSREGLKVRRDLPKRTVDLTTVNLWMRKHGILLPTKRPKRKIFQYQFNLLCSILCESYKTCNEKNLCVSHDLYFIGELHHKIRMLLRFYRRNNFKSWDSIISLELQILGSLGLKLKEFICFLLGMW